jgi:hypothetical protein
MNLYTEKLKQHFRAYPHFSKEDVSAFYNTLGSKVSELDLFWYLYALKQESVINKVNEYQYKLAGENKPIFSPKIAADLWAINNVLMDKFHLEDYCIWSSDWFNDLMVHQVVRNFTVIEVDSGVSESVFYYLRDRGYKDTFLLLIKADEMLLDRYVFEAQNPIVITKIISKSPVKKIAQNGASMKVPKLEKLLVDLFCDDALLAAYKGASQQTIFENALTHYDINFKTLFAYAERRKKEAALKTYLHQYFQTELKQLLE